MSTTYDFEKFVINATDQDMTVVAHYRKESNMGTIIFSGTVSAQAGAGRAIVITITKPVGTAVVNTVTLADKTFTATYTDVAGSYSAHADVAEQQDANTVYSAGASPQVPFTMAKTTVPTTVTLTVS